jgi:diguanylate cyclase (GGDEF)-like protein
MHGMLSAMLSICSDPLVVLGPRRDPGGNVVDFVGVLANAHLELSAGISLDEVIGQPVERFLPSVHTHQASLVDVVETGSQWRTQLIVHSFGGEQAVSVQANRLSMGAVSVVLLALNDTDQVRRLVQVIDELLERQHELEIQALHDPLTGCANRLLIKTRLEHGISRLDRQTGSLAVMFIDLDRFKDVNDDYGHAVGDAVLITIAQRMQAQARPYDTVGRLGGDEFVVVCEDLTTRDDVHRLTHRMFAACCEPIDIDGEVITVSASIGVALANTTKSDPATLIDIADRAMYQAKSNNGHQVVYATDPIQRVSARDGM